MVSKVVHSTNSDEWPTPAAFFDMLNSEFVFTLDPCSTDENAKCGYHFTKEQNGLMKDWRGHTAFVNPPYSQAAAWVEKSKLEARKGSTVVMLLASRTGSDWFCDGVLNYAAEIRFVRGRLRFVGGKSGAPFDSAVIVFRPGHTGDPKVSSIGRNIVESAVRKQTALVEQGRML